MTEVIKQWAGAALMSLALLGSGFSLGVTYSQRQAATEAVTQANTQTAAVLHAVKDNAATEKTQVDKNTKVLNANEKANTEVKTTGAAIRKSVNAAGGLRISTTSTCSGPAPTGETTDASQVDGATAGTVALPKEVEGNLWELMEEADLIVERTRSTVEWGVEQGFVAEVPK